MVIPLNRVYCNFLFTIRPIRKWEVCKVKKKCLTMANNQEKFHEIIIFYKKNIILDLFLRNLEILVTFARRALLGMKIQEVMK